MSRLESEQTEMQIVGKGYNSVRFVRYPRRKELCQYLGD